MNATVDPDLMKLVLEHVNLLKKDVNKIAFQGEEEKKNRKKIESALVNVFNRLDELESSHAKLQSELSSTSVKVEEIKTRQERFEEQLSDSCPPEIIYGKLKMFFVISYLVQYWHCLRLHFVHFKLTQLDGKLDCKMCKEKH